jgi:sugar transferase (PEP-CTERM/EpsH1 system associated)
MTSLRILLLSPWMPWPPHDGGRIRVLNTLRYLSQRHRVTLLAPSRTSRDVDAIAELRPFCETVATADLAGDGRAVLARAVGGALRRRPLIESVHHGRALAAELRDLTADRVYDIVQVEFSWFTPYLRALHERSRARTVLTMHNVESLRFARELRASTTLGRRVVLGWDQLFARTWEQEAVRRVDAVVAVSDTERVWVEQVAPDVLVTVAPNGVDTEHFRPVPAASTRSLVFTGAMDYPPNVDAVLWFCREVWPILRRRNPSLRFEVVGKAPDARVRALNGEAGIRVTGEVPDVRLLLAQASVVVVPLRAGAGTRLKILEAMAMGRPVVSTTLGAEGLDVVEGANILLADTPGSFAGAVESVLHSPETAHCLSEGGRRLVVGRYDWRQCLRPLETLYQRALERDPISVTTRAANTPDTHERPA